jgi:hypothetical protein
MGAAHITSVVVHGGAMTGWSYVFTILVPLAVFLTAVATHPSNMLFNHLINSVNSSTDPSFLTSRPEFQLE